MWRPVKSVPPPWCLPETVSCEVPEVPNPDDLERVGIARRKNGHRAAAQRGIERCHRRPTLLEHSRNHQEPV